MRRRLRGIGGPFGGWCVDDSHPRETGRAPQWAQHVDSERRCPQDAVEVAALYPWGVFLSAPVAERKLIRVKIRLVNEMDSDHPMHHPFHIHGASRHMDGALPHRQAPRE